MRKEWNTPEIDTVEFENTKHGGIANTTPDSSYADVIVGEVSWGSASQFSTRIEKFIT